MSPASPADSLETPVEGLHAAPTSRLPYQANVMVRSFLLRRPAGNVIVYNSPGLSTAASQIRDLGGASRLLLNHGHEAMHGQPDLEVDVFVHERDRAETARSVRVAGIFTGRRMIDDDLEVIPTPGHTPGATCYLWEHGDHRFLFTGGYLWIEDDEWKAVVLDESLRGHHLTSLALVRELDVDVLVPWGTSEGGPCLALVDEVERRARIDEIITRVAAGANR